MSEIHQVTLWSHGMVMTTAATGKLMPEYQGPLGEVGAKILRDAPESAGFNRDILGAGSRHQLVPISRTDFAKLVSDARTVGLSQQ